MAKLTDQQIFDKVKARFADRKIEFVAGFGDPWIKVEPSAWPDVALFLRDDPDLKLDYLMCLTAVDFQTHLASVYNLISTKHVHRSNVHVEVPRDRPFVPTCEHVWPTANWHEREAYDLVGIKYMGHSDLRRILLPEDWEGFPLRKDYDFPKEYHGIPLY
ncbi:MAG: NADH-quinone oxidoreductase subunit C [Planctomycetota bacterium]